MDKRRMIEIRHWDFCLFRINKLLLKDILKYLIIKLSGKIFCHREVHVEIVAAVAGSGTRNFALIVADEEKHLLEKRDDVRGLIIACEKEIEAGTASHRAEVENFILVNAVVS